MWVWLGICVWGNTYNRGTHIPATPVLYNTLIKECTHHENSTQDNLSLNELILVAVITSIGKGFHTDAVEESMRIKSIHSGKGWTMQWSARLLYNRRVL